MTTLLYAEQASYITKVLEVLNSDTIPNSPDYYLHVELKDQDGNTVATFSDEIASDCWSVEFKD